MVYLTTGLWALIDIESFMMVSGPKEDLWLVRTVGLLVTATGLGLIVAALRRELSLPVITIALSNALFLAGVDVFYATNDIIWDIYLIDALFELVVATGWIFVLMSDYNERSLL